MSYRESKPLTRIARFFKRRRMKKKKRKGLFFKFLVATIVLHGLACVTFSYYLAWSDKTNVVEAVSVAVITEIVAPLVTYAISKTVENIFEKNNLSFSSPIEQGGEESF